MVLDSGKVYVNDFYFSHKDRHLRINGIVSPQPEDTVRLDLKEINIGYVFDIADLGVNFKGEATGPAFASGVLETPRHEHRLVYPQSRIERRLAG